MKVCIAGSRDFVGYKTLEECIFLSQFPITRVIVGGAKGVDSLGLRWAVENGIPFDLYNADWNKYGKRAGFLRNEDMIREADALIAISLNHSKGTEHSIRLAKKKGIPVYLFRAENGVPPGRDNLLGFC